MLTPRGETASLLQQSRDATRPPCLPSERQADRLRSQPHVNGTREEPALPHGPGPVRLLVYRLFNDYERIQMKARNGLRAG